MCVDKTFSKYSAHVISTILVFIWVVRIAENIAKKCMLRNCHFLSIECIQCKPKETKSSFLSSIPETDNISIKC